ncbi:MAG TPA: invasion associated locus B family protein [Microvirga sp.]|nr:invasion associated locus B family protein [Microvirga sp.]
MTRSTLLAFAVVALSAGCAFAQTPRLLGSYDSWSAWTFRENKSNVCYVYTDADTKKPETLDHGRVGFSIRNLERGRSRTEAGFLSGYELAPQPIRVVVDGKRFTMIPRGRHAWLRREEREGEFLQALMRGRTMTVEAVSRRGNKTSYRFSLAGATKAVRKARQSCR